MDYYIGTQRNEYANDYYAILVGNDYNLFVNRNPSFMEQYYQYAYNLQDQETIKYNNCIKIEQPYNNWSSETQYYSNDLKYNLRPIPAYMPPYEMNKNKESQTLIPLRNINNSEHIKRHYEILRNRDYRSNQQDDSENLKFSNNTKFQDSQDQLKISEPSASVPQPEESKQKTVKEMYESITPKLVIICHCCGKVNHTSFQCTSDPLPENQLISILQDNKEYMAMAQSVVCYKCGQIGHFPVLCNKLRRDAEMQKLMKYEVECVKNAKVSKIPNLHSSDSTKDEKLSALSTNSFQQKSESQCQISSSWDKILRHVIMYNPFVYSAVLNYYTSNINEFKFIKRSRRNRKKKSIAKSKWIR